jgi:hypothetical protein
MKKMKRNKKKSKWFNRKANKNISLKRKKKKRNKKKR